MDDDESILVDSGYMKAKNVTLTAEQVEYLEAMQHRLGISSFSATLRFCLMQYIREEKRLTDQLKAIKQEIDDARNTTQA